MSKLWSLSLQKYTIRGVRQPKDRLLATDGLSDEADTAIGSKMRSHGERLMYRYKISLAWREIDRVFVAEVPELPGCTAHGDTRADALKHVDEAIQLWIDTAREFGDSVPEPRIES